MYYRIFRNILRKRKYIPIGVNYAHRYLSFMWIIISCELYYGIIIVFVCVSARLFSRLILLCIRISCYQLLLRCCRIEITTWSSIISALNKVVSQVKYTTTCFLVSSSRLISSNLWKHRRLGPPPEFSVRVVLTFPPLKLWLIEIYNRTFIMLILSIFNIYS